MRNRIHIGRSLAGMTAALLVATTAACGGNAEGGGADSAAGETTITVAEQSRAGMTTGLWPHLAEALGYFEDEGIVIDDYVSVTKGSDAISGMQSGEVQISHIGVDGIVAASKGAEIVGIAAGMDASIWTVVASPEVKSWDDLEGKTIALGSTSDITRVIFDRLAEQAGLDPAGLEYIALGATPQRIAAVQNDQAAATIATYPPVAEVMKSGNLTNLGFAPTGTERPRLMTTDIETSKTWAEENPEVVTGYLRAIMRAVDFVRDPANEDKAVQEIQKLTDYSPEAIRKGLKVYFSEPKIKNAYFPNDYRHDDEVFKATVDAYVDLGLMNKPITEQEYMDYSYLEAARKK